MCAWAGKEPYLKHGLEVNQELQVDRAAVQTMDHLVSEFYKDVRKVDPNI